MNPLDQLQPLLAPAPIGWWPLAPGWWALLLLLPLLAWGLWRLRHWRPGKSPSCAPNCLWTRYASRPWPNSRACPNPTTVPGRAWLQQINALLKRLCRNHYPGSHSHTLNGRQWLAFLDNRCPAAGLTRWMVLVEGAYKPECKLDDKAINGLNQSVETWIRKHV
nr:DUF4381 domain-containing protein [Pseudomonas sp. BIGb0427]